MAEFIRYIAVSYLGDVMTESAYVSRRACSFNADEPVSAKNGRVTGHKFCRHEAYIYRHTILPDRWIVSHSNSVCYIGVTQICLAACDEVNEMTCAAYRSMHLR